MLVKEEAKPIVKQGISREAIMEVEEAIKSVPGSMIGDCFPLTHTFADGMYIREIRVPKGILLVTKIHKKTHPAFLLKGDVSILTEEGVKRIQAPYSMITKAGTKRVIYIHEDCVWTTVHKTDETDLEKIEEEIIAKSFDEIEGLEGYVDVEAAVEEARITNFLKEVTAKEEQCPG